MAQRVTRREFLNTAAATTGTLAASRLSRAAAPERPNVLFILADDLAGRVTEQASITMDWSATLAVSGTAADPNSPLDGEDLMPICRGMRPVHDRTLF